MIHTKRGLVTGTYIITLLYFSLGFLTIYTGLLAFACMTLPFLLIARHQEKRWCIRYCPRASLITQTGKVRAKWKSVPKSWTNGSARKLMLWYFSLNLLFITGSTIQVARGSMTFMPYIRLFIAIPLWPLPQLVEIAGPAWLTHLSYRFYSMMLSTTILGILFSRIMRPRAWCAVCPVGTLSNTMLRASKQHWNRI